MGRQCEAALKLFVHDINAAGGIAVGGEKLEVALECRDDESNPARTAEIYHWLCAERRADLIFGPYSSRLMRVAAPIVEKTEMTLINHGGASDELYRRGYRMIVGVLSPASTYLLPLARLLATMKFWRKRVAIVSSPTPFASEVATGFENACRERWARRRGVRVRLKYIASGQHRAWPRLAAGLKRSRINILAGVGTFEEDVELMREMTTAELNLPVLACVAAGVANFGAVLGEHAEGIVGPSGWEEDVELTPERGPAPQEFGRRMRNAFPGVNIDYPAAQTYAAGLLTAAALERAGTLDQHKLRDAFSDLRTTTLYGDFAIDHVTGRQVEHKTLLVQWHRGRKVIIAPDSEAADGALELPSGWRLILSSFQQFRLTRHEDHDDDAEG
jgi:branched-chain amino acid transport system substrate-binding protein